MGHISLLDALEWTCKLRKKKIIKFEFKDLPNELKDLKLLRRAKEEGLIRKILRKENGRNIWELSDKLKCKDIEIILTDNINIEKIMII